MNKSDIIRAYFNGLEARSYEQVMSLFAQDAMVHSPLYGDVNAQQFYQELFAATESSVITLKNILVSTTNSHVAAAHFLYDWILKDGSPAPFECIDVFEFSDDNKIIDLKIIYDTYFIRGVFEAMAKGQ